MKADNPIIQRMQELYESALKEFDAARIQLDNIVECFISDINSNMGLYIFNNIKREIRKNPGAAGNLSQERLADAFLDAEAAIQEKLPEIISKLREFSGWHDEDTVFLDRGSKPWKWIKSIEEPVNKIQKKYELSAVDMKNWTWLSLEINELITTRFAEGKKNFLDKRKQLKYIEGRLREEEKIHKVLGKLGE